MNATFPAAPEVVSRVREGLHEFRREEPALDGFIRRLSATGRVGVVGGAVRDWALGREPQDVDFVFAGAPHYLQALVEGRYPHDRTSFGGYRLHGRYRTVDVWATSKSLGVRGGDQEQVPRRFHAVSRAATFNIDSGVVDPAGTKLFEAGLRDGFRRRVLVLHDVDHPRPTYVAARAVRLATRYQLALDVRLQAYLNERVPDRRGWEETFSIFRSRYGEVPAAAGVLLGAVVVAAFLGELGLHVTTTLPRAPRFGQSE